MQKPMSDEASRGDRALVAAWFREYSRELHAFLRRRLGRADRIDDVIQTTFARLAAVPRLERIAQPNAYIFVIARNVLRELRLRERREQDVVTFGAEALEAAQRMGDAVPDESEALNLRRQLEEALAKLPDTHRMVLLALKRDGLTYEEVSRATGISVAMVEKYLIQAKAKIMAMTWER